MSVRRVGTVLGLDDAGQIQAVSVYRDGNGYKLSGRGGSCIIEPSAIEVALGEVAERYRLSKVEFVRSTRAA